MNSSLPILKIDKDFKKLIYPLTKREYILLENNILSEGCKESILTWNDIIVDGHNRYSICTKHNIPFTVAKIEFDSRPAVIAWICKKQLERTNLTEEMRKYLIGMQYESTKIASKLRNPKGNNQYMLNEEYIPNTPIIQASKISTAHRIGKENNLTHTTVRKYAAYARAIERLRKKAPDFVDKILSGKYKIAHNNIMELSRLPQYKLETVINEIGKIRKSYVQYSTTRDIVQNVTNKQPPSVSEPMPPLPSIKDMPTFDPDAPFIELSLTIPSWIGSLQRAYVNINSTPISENAKAKLTAALVNLNEQIDKIIIILSEK